MRISLGHCLEYTRKCQFFFWLKCCSWYLANIGKDQNITQTPFIKDIVKKKKDIQIVLFWI